MRKHLLFVTIVLVLMTGVPPSSAAKTINGLTYTYPVENLKLGQSLGNANCYVTLDNKTDLWNDYSSVRYGLRESTNQKYYLLGWDVALSGPDGTNLNAIDTTFAPAYQESHIAGGPWKIRKRFFVPFENGYLRSAHFILSANNPPSGLVRIRS